MREGVSPSPGGQKEGLSGNCKPLESLEGKTGEYSFEGGQTPWMSGSAVSALGPPRAKPFQFTPSAFPGNALCGSTGLVWRRVVAGPDPTQPAQLQTCWQPPFPCRLSPVGELLSLEAFKRPAFPNQGENFLLLNCAAFLGCLLCHIHPRRLL